jgi:transposase InsO family protein
VAASRRGNCYDNAMTENFFDILKTECIYKAKPKSFAEAKQLIDDYIRFYNHECIQLKIGESPFTAASLLKNSLTGAFLRISANLYAVQCFQGSFYSP